MRHLLLAALAFGCASQSKGTPAPAATVMAGSLPSNAPEPEPKTTPERGPAEAKPSVPGAAGARGAMTAPSGAGGAMTASGGAMTAAEAAASLAALRSGGPESPSGAASTSASEEGPCEADADCVFSRIAPGACCPMLCTPRAVTKKAAGALDAHVQSCAAGRECPLPSCRPPRAMTMPACVQSRCVVRVRDEKGVQ